MCRRRLISRLHLATFRQWLFTVMFPCWICSLVFRKFRDCNISVAFRRISLRRLLCSSNFFFQRSLSLAERLAILPDFITFPFSQLRLPAWILLLQNHYTVNAEKEASWRDIYFSSHSLNIIRHEMAARRLPLPAWILLLQNHYITKPSTFQFLCPLEFPQFYAHNLVFVGII